MSLSNTAKQMLMGDLDLGQFIFKSTDTMLPKTHSDCMTALLQLFKHVVVCDVASGSKRCAVAMLVPISQLNRWVPDSRYLVQTFSSQTVELIATEDIAGRDEWPLSGARTHRLNEFPKRHLPRLARIAGSESVLNGIWETMSLVFIWEKEEMDDLAGLLEYINEIV